MENTANYQQMATMASRKLLESMSREVCVCVSVSVSLSLCFFAYGFLLPPLLVACFSHAVCVDSVLLLLLLPFVCACKGAAEALHRAGAAPGKARRASARSSDGRIPNDQEDQATETV